MDLRQLQQEYLDNLRKVTEEKLEIGTLIRTVISIDEGLVFKDGKHFIQSNSFMQGIYLFK